MGEGGRGRGVLIRSEAHGVAAVSVPAAVLSSQFVSDRLYPSSLHTFLAFHLGGPAELGIDGVWSTHTTIVTERSVTETEILIGPDTGRRPDNEPAAVSRQKVFLWRQNPRPLLGSSQRMEASSSLCQRWVQGRKEGL